ncbi:GldG family protein [Altericista sp. CCNU0014]|uniref:GldG family protein n=1 Tax=Altericista sp. CCNU0014 TaxID=3082949 RepID=UPI00385101FA
MAKSLIPKLNLSPKLIDPLFWVGLGLAIAGGSASLVSGAWSPVGIGLVAAGLVAIALWLILRWLNASDASAPWWRQRSVQAGTNALLTTVAVFAILGSINFLAVRVPSQIDFTENQQFSLAPQTKQLIRSLKQPVKVRVFSNQPTPVQQSLLEQYRRQNPDRLSFEFIDPQAQPGLAEKYKIRTPGEVVLETGDRTRTLEGELNETNLTPAVASLLRDRKLNAYILQGHDEAPINGGQGNLDAAVTELKKRDFNVNVLNLLAQKQIPADANVLIVAGPKRAYLDGEVKLLQNYLKDGKSLMLMLDPGVKTGLEPLLEDWGVTLDNRVIVDASGSGQLLGLGPAIPLVVQYGNHPIAKDFGEGPSFFPLAQAVTVTPPSADVQVTDLLKTSPQSWAEADSKQEKLQFDAARDRQGPLTIGVALTRTFESTPTPVADKTKPEAAAKPSPASKVQAKMVVIGDSDFATVGNPQVINSDLFLNAVTWLGSGPEDPSLSIRPKETKDRRIELNPTNWRLLIVAGLGFLPLAGFGTGAYLWWRRR